MAGPDRVLPAIVPETAFFWQGGRDGLLRILRCFACGHFLHPPSPICPICLSRALAPEAVSGRATVSTYTINHQAWKPGLQTPFVVAIVELEEQAGLRLTTNLIHCDPQAVHIGMPVKVVFEQVHDVWLPLFAPA